MNAQPRPCFGREPQLELLRFALDGTSVGGQQFVLFEGDPGIGKSTLLRAFGERSSTGRWWKRPRVLYLQAPQGEPYRPVRHAALAATSRRIYRTIEGERQVGELARDLAPDWVGAIPIWGDLIAAMLATVDAVLRRRRRKRFAALDTTDEYVEALLSAAKRRPLVLLLDDLEQADREAVGQLEALICIADEGARILIVGAYRPTPPGVADPPVHRMLRRLPKAEESYVQRRLDPLERGATEAWLRERLQTSELPTSLLDSVLEITGGHPGEIVSTLERMMAAGALVRGEQGWTFIEPGVRLDAGMPNLHSYSDLSSIDPQISATVIAASRLSEDFDALTLAGSIRVDELLVEDQLALAERYGILFRIGDREVGDEITTAYRFASPHLRAALRREALSASRCESAALPADTLERVPDPAPPPAR